MERQELKQMQKEIQQQKKIPRLFDDSSFPQQNILEFQESRLKQQTKKNIRKERIPSHSSS